MEISRGVHTCGLRIRLTLQSEDVETHAAMTDELEIMNSAADVAAHEARLRIRQKLAPKTEVYASEDTTRPPPVRVLTPEEIMRKEKEIPE
jgi:hypothetical protein